MTTKSSRLPSFEALFGTLDLQKSDEARSVYSPAAYLADLLHLLDDKFLLEGTPDEPGLHRRRPDIQAVPLNAESTFTEIPYLDIVNEVLAKAVGEDAFSVLRAARYPLQLPFHLEDEQYKQYLRALGVDSAHLYWQFAPGPDDRVIAREHLGLSQEEYGFITKELSDAAVGAAYGLADGEPLSALLTLDSFMRRTGLGHEQLHELLSALPAAAFISQGLGGHMVLAAGGGALAWHTPADAPGAPPDAVLARWLDRVSRFVLLARRLGLTYSELDVALRSCCDSRLDEDALQTLAVVQQLRQLHDLSLMAVCDLFGPLAAVVATDQAQDAAPSPLLAAQLGISEKQLTALAARYEARVAAPLRARAQPPADQPTLAAFLFRVSGLARALDISHDELLRLLDVLEADPSIRTYNTLGLLIKGDPQALDCHAMLAGSTMPAIRWLVQTLFALGRWMEANSFSADELAQILSGRSKSDAVQRRRREQKIAALDTLYQQFKPLMLDASLFVSERFDQRAARVIFEQVTASGAGLASPDDRRLLRFDKARATAVAHRALAQLARLGPDDFAQLGLEERLLDKIFRNLVLRGYLTAEGGIVERHLPEQPAAFVLAADFEAQREALFALIAGIYSEEDRVEAADTGEGAVVDLGFYPSDLAALEGLAPAERDELYDNLIYNGYIDADGAVLRAELFAFDGNVGDFAVNVEFGTAPGAVYAIMAAQVRRFAAAPLALTAAAFRDLPISEAGAAALVENLHFNAYLDADGNIADKRKLLGLGATDFSLALEFYPLREAILELVQQHIATFQAGFYTLTREHFRAAAAAEVARRVVAHLAREYLIDGQADEATWEFFRDPESRARFQISPGFTAADSAVVFDHIGGMLAALDPYRLAPHALDAHGFSSEERAELLAVLTEAGHLAEGRFLDEASIPYFLNIDNAIVFSVRAFEDYSKDVFFLLHEMAKATDTAVAEIVDRLGARAEEQAAAVLAVLQDALGVDGAIVAVICEHVLGGLEHVVDAMLPPVLALVDGNDRVTREPDSRAFNITYSRMEQAAWLASKLGLSGQEAAVAFRDQGLVDKYPERLALPAGVEQIDALWPSPDGVIYLFSGGSFWAYSAHTYALLSPAGRPIKELSTDLEPLAQIDAAFSDADGAAVIIGRDAQGGSHYFVRAAASQRWAAKERAWGQFENNFADPAAIDTAFQDREGKTYLFSGSQYIRYSGDDFSFVDEGYPRAIAGNWQQEGWGTLLPGRFRTSIDASFLGADGKTYLFKGQHYISSDALAEEQATTARWGHVRSNLSQAARLDAAYSDGPEHYLFAGDQVLVYEDSLENEQVAVREGYPRRIEAVFPNLPAEFESGLEAAFKGADGHIHLFKDGKTVAFKLGAAEIQPVRTEVRWGLVVNRIRERRRVDAAFVGLDGKTYLFSDDQFVRYSGADYTQVDEGYPRLIADHWGGLRSVDAAFVLDGKTYLFGKDGAGAAAYVRYSRRDYTEVDEGYPTTPNDNWWNLPVALVAEGAPFGSVDAVFAARDGRTYLFSGDRFIAYDHKERWWSEPQPITDRWDSLGFTRIDAAFVGKDGKTYIFSDDMYVRYSGSNYSRIDDRYPNTIHTYWGNVANNIAKTGRIDAALVLDAQVNVGGAPQSVRYTYLFSGNQYVRYTGDTYVAVDPGYPRSIAASLKSEPRFANLPLPFENGIDAALADRRNLYLFKDRTWHVISDALYSVYDLGLGRVDTAFLDEGALVIEAGGRWLRYGPLEGFAPTPEPADPPLLRRAPDTFRQGLSAVLSGADQNSYLFKGASCFNVLLGKEYPLSEEWGRPRNNIDLHGRVDAALAGRDGKTYLFSGDQFFTYARAPYVDAEAERLSQPVAAHWGGLASVALAYIHGEKTYLLEPAGADGIFRYVCYSTPDYSRPDEGFPKRAGFDFWQIPAQYRDEGFAEVRAVLFEGENRLLIGRDRYLQLHEPTGAWSYPRPLSRIWRDFPLDRLTFPGVRTAFTGADGATYFFGDEHYTCFRGGAFTAPAPIRGHWGLTDNNFVNVPLGSAVDAAFVYRGAITYLFSGDQYVRYSGRDYRTVDPGYPRPLVGNLRREAGFQNLPDSFEDVLAARVDAKATPVIDAVVANERSLYIFIDGRCHVVSQSLTAAYDLGRLGRVRNRLLDTGRVDAALVTEDAQRQPQTFLFSGDQYVRYTGAAYDLVDDGYPRPIASAFAAEIGLDELPAAFHHGIDAALRTADGSIYLFKGGVYLRQGQAPAPVNTLWGKVRSTFAENAGLTPVDAAFIAPDGRLYVFKGGQYVRYQSPGQPLVDEGFPRSIKDSWGDLPARFEGGLDGGFVFEGRTYLHKGEQYVRYSAADYSHVDAMYPQRFRDRWGPWADYLLSDLDTILRFKQLQDQHGGQELSLADFLDAGADPIDAPFERLAELFDWPVDEVKWLKRRNGFLSAAPLFEEQFTLELILRMHDSFALAARLGARPSELYSGVWLRRFDPERATIAAARQVNEVLAGYLALALGEQAWPARARELHNELNLLKRDALVARLLATLDGVENAGDLYERYLIDIEMGGAGLASRVQEAIAATQLYIHRYLVNLEDVSARNGDDDQVRNVMRAWWKWMQNYRVWEANRKVFLYPENYIRPELRDTKTPAFKTLEDDLLQGEITETTVQRAYKKYLDEYTEVSRLAIAGGYVYTPNATEEVERRLILFGRTRTDPRRYYYRTAELLGGPRPSFQWSPWLSVNVQIDADVVYPIYAFDRVFVFWAKVEVAAETATSTQLTTKKEGDVQTVSSNASATYTATVYYSFYNLNKEWVPAQQLRWVPGQIPDDSMTHPHPISDLKLFVEWADEIKLKGARTDEHDNIIVNCSYKTGDAEVIRALVLTPELYCKPIARHNFDDNGAEVFNAIFDEPSFDEASVVRFNTVEKSTDGPWFSFDHKGGSFLCRSAEPPLPRGVWPRERATNPDGLPRDWPRLDAAFTLPDGVTYFFNKDSAIYRAAAYDTAAKQYRALAGAAGGDQAIRQRWGKRYNKIADVGKLDAALVQDGKSYLFRDDEFLTYEGDLQLADAAGPSPLAANALGFPTAPLRAAFNGVDGKTYFFDRASARFYARDRGTLGEARNVVERWGKIAPATVSLAFTSGEQTHLVYGEIYRRYEGAAYTSAEPVYPQPSPGLLDLPALAGVRAASAVDPKRLANAFFSDGFLYFQYKGEAQFQRIQVRGGGEENLVDFFKHINEEILAAVVVKGTKIYAFKRKVEGAAPFVGLCIYDVDAGQKKEGAWTHHTIKITSRGKALTIDQALVGRDGKFYLFAGNDYMRADDLESKIKDGALSWSKSGSILNDLLRINNRIAETGNVDAALVRDGLTYLFSGDQYVRYTGGKYDYVDPFYPKPLRGNAEGLPEWPEVGAVFSAPDGQIFCFDNADPEPSFALVGSLQQRTPTRERWGIIRNNITAHGVDTAYVWGGCLFLTSGEEYVRYSLDAEGRPGRFIDGGYPRNIRFDVVPVKAGGQGRLSLAWAGMKQIDAALVKGPSLYLFGNDRYFKLTASGAALPEPDAMGLPRFIRRNWGNLPIDLRSGFDATLARDKTLYIFKGGQYARFDDDIWPYDVAEARYEIVRLTTSTAFALNQRLFAGGVAALLSLATQEIDELPSFSEGESTATNISIRPGRSIQRPISSHLDFDSANGTYYWEIFFHAPLLIAQSLNVGQKFAEAKQWHEYIYDPTEHEGYWKFLPFLTVDIAALARVCRTALDELRALDVDVSSVAPGLEAILASLEPWADVFQQRRALRDDEEAALDASLKSLSGPIAALAAALGALRAALEQPEGAPADARARRAGRALTVLQEYTASMADLWRRYRLLAPQAAQIRAYLNDPFDPHAIAALRTAAYRKAVVMSYIDNLIDWGDMLFRQYTRESIDEARMLYILAYDLLGARPRGAGAAAPAGSRRFAELVNASAEYDLLVYPTGTPHDSAVGDSYFTVPENSLFSDYWARVEDRLGKIRASLNILGVSQPLPLFEPPIDPMAMVQAVGSGASLGAAMAGLSAPVPPYRFSFMLRKAQDLVQKLGGLSGDLLGALEKQDAEELSLLQSRQQSVILGMTRAIKEAQVKIAGETIRELELSRQITQERARHYRRLIDAGLSPHELKQIDLMRMGSESSLVGSILSMASGVVAMLPQIRLGPFSFGTETGGVQISEALAQAGEAGQTLSEYFSLAGEVAGVYAAHLRSREDWQLQLSTAESDAQQIERRLAGARLQEQLALHELAAHDQEIRHAEAISAFMQEKFTSAQLYRWMAGRLSGLYYQTNNLAYELARGAERALQFERGLRESAATFIQPLHWESQRKGLLAGASLGLDLDRMEKAAIDEDARGLEITRQISLLDLDPVALLQLKSRGVCEFALGEALFDHDFPGHYRRQIRTLAVTFADADGQPLRINATLTQLSHKTVLEPDLKAIKHLLDPREQPPPSLRGDWRASQQIALSEVGEYDSNSGLFELRFDDERYLPFEGTGAVSTWRLELGGGKGAAAIAALRDVTVTLKYTADQGGALFAAGVRGLLKPTPTARYFDLAREFPDEWADFVNGEDDTLQITLTREMFAGMSSSKIAGLFAHYELDGKGQVSLTLNDDEALTLKEGRYVPTSGLSISSRGSDWSLALTGDKAALRNVALVVGYIAKAS